MRGFLIKQKTASEKDCGHRREATYFRAKALSSALGDFTSVFGMGTGGALPV